MNITQRIMKILDEFPLPENFTLTLPLKDLTLDSLDILDLHMRIEDEFDITIPDSLIEEDASLSDVITYIKSKCD